MTKRILQISIFVACLIALTGTVFVAADAITDSLHALPAPKLLAKGNGFLIHVFPGSPSRMYFGTRLTQSGLSITYTSLDSGEMKILFRSGEYFIGTVGGRWDYSRIIGASHDKDYLFLCEWRSDNHSGPAYPSLFRYDPDTKGDYMECNKGRIGVRMFLMRTGEQILAVELYPGEYPAPDQWPDLHNQLTTANLESKLPKAVPDETVEAGPLRLVKDAIECYGIVIRYKSHIVERHPGVPFGGAPKSLFAP